MPTIDFNATLPYIKGLIAVSLFYFLARFASKSIPAIFKNRMDLRSQGILSTIVKYLLLVAGALFAMKQIGIDISVLVGAAGLLTVAIGFAAQTSTANIISGIFLMFEKRFGMSDVIEVGNNMGEVISIGLLSTEIRTFDNLAIRIPNEMLMKSEVKVLTRFEIRRIDLSLRVNLHEEFERVQKLLANLVTRNPLCLDEPSPQFLIGNHSDAGLEFQFFVWTKRENFRDVKNQLQIDILRMFDEEGVEVPFPKRMMIPSNVDPKK